MLFGAAAFKHTVNLSKFTITILLSFWYFSLDRLNRIICTTVCWSESCKSFGKKFIREKRGGKYYSFPETIDRFKCTFRLSVKNYKCKDSKMWCEGWKWKWIGQAKRMGSEISKTGYETSFGSNIVCHWTMQTFFISSLIPWIDSLFSLFFLLITWATNVTFTSILILNVISSQREIILYPPSLYIYFACRLLVFSWNPIFIYAWTLVMDGNRSTEWNLGFASHFVLPFLLF